MFGKKSRKETTAGKKKAKFAGRKSKTGVQASLDETVFESVLDELEENEPFRLDHGQFAVIEIDGDTIGLNGSKISEGSDLGQFIHAIHTGMINTINLEDLARQNRFLIIPNQISLTNMDDFAMVKTCEFPLDSIDENQTVKSLDVSVTFDDLKDILDEKKSIRNLIQPVAATAALEDTDAALQEDDDLLDTENDSDIPDEPEQDPVQEPIEDDDDFQKNAADEYESTGYNNFTQMQQQIQDYSPQDISQQPMDDPNEPFMQQPVSAPGADSADLSAYQEQYPQPEETHSLFLRLKDKPIDNNIFLKHVSGSAPFQFPLISGDDPVIRQGNSVIASWNRELESRYNEIVMGCNRAVNNIIASSIPEIEREYSLDNRQGQIGKDYLQLQDLYKKQKERARNDIRAVQKSYDADFETRAIESGKSAEIQAYNQYKADNQPELEDAKQRYEREAMALIHHAFDQKKAELEQRSLEYMDEVLKQKIVEAVQSATSTYDRAMRQYNESLDQRMEYYNKYIADIQKQQKLSLENEQKRLEKSQSEDEIARSYRKQIAQIQESHSQSDRINSERYRELEQQNHLKDDYNAKLEQKLAVLEKSEAEKDRLIKSQEDELASVKKKTRRKVKEEFQSTLGQVQEENHILKEELAKQKQSRKNIFIIMGLIAAACVVIGLVIGMLMNFNYSRQAAREQIQEEFTKRVEKDSAKASD